jgi:hypothetical protein
MAVLIHASTRIYEWIECACWAGPRPPPPPPSLHATLRRPATTRTRLSSCSGVRDAEDRLRAVHHTPTGNDIRGVDGARRQLASLNARGRQISRQEEAWAEPMVVGLRRAGYARGKAGNFRAIRGRWRGIVRTPLWLWNFRLAGQARAAESLEMTRKQASLSTPLPRRSRRAAPPGPSPHRGHWHRT